MKKKLIEVALPLEAINKESAREKSIRHGHPSTLHLWWARRPLAACRAVLFASLVDDPGSRPDLFPTEESQREERERLFDLLSELVKWENINNEGLLKQAKEAIWRSAGPEGPPPVHDPFCGGGSIPLEAQRLGLEAHGSDLNPVAVAPAQLHRAAFKTVAFPDEDHVAFLPSLERHRLDIQLLLHFGKRGIPEISNFEELIFRTRNQFPQGGNVFRFQAVGGPNGKLQLRNRSR